MAGRLTDISLATQVAVLHSRRAFDLLVREYQSPVRRFFLGQTLGNAALCDDLSQDTFVKAYMHISQYRGTSSFLTWLMRIAYNVWYDHCRDEQRRRRHEQSTDAFPALESMASAGQSSTAASQLSADIYTALAQLKEEERTCVTLQLVEGYSINEIAEMIGMPTGTVKSHLKRGKEKLAVYLRKNGYDR